MSTWSATMRPNRAMSTEWSRSAMSFTLASLSALARSAASAAAIAARASAWIWWRLRNTKYPASPGSSFFGAVVLMPIAANVAVANSSARSANSGNRDLISSASSSTTRLVRTPSSERSRVDSNATRVARFQDWLETRERRTPPYIAVFGLPVSSRLRLLGGTVCRIWMSTRVRFTVFSFLRCVGRFGVVGTDRSGAVEVAAPGQPHLVGAVRIQQPDQVIGESRVVETAMRRAQLRDHPADVDEGFVHGRCGGHRHESARDRIGALLAAHRELAHGPSQRDAMHMRRNGHGLLMHREQRQCRMGSLLGAARLIAVPPQRFGNRADCELPDLGNAARGLAERAPQPGEIRPRAR